MKSKQKRRITQSVSVLLCVLLCILLKPCSVKAETADTHTVKVGYYPVATYQDVYEDGTYSGFSYDYYIQMKKYTRWNYEFVEASYSECLQMLVNGEIDIMAGVNRTTAREENMLFSDYTISSSQNKLYALNDADLYYEDYEGFDGGKIGIIKGMMTDEIESYAAKNGFHMEFVYFDNDSEMEKALVEGQIDLAYTASVSKDLDSKIVARLDKHPLYYVVNKNRPELVSELDGALKKIIDNNPEFYTQMSEKYKISGANAVATFTKEEVEYIESGQKIYLIVNAYWEPITYYDQASGTYKGIFIDTVKEIEKVSGLEFVTLTEDEFNEKAKNDPTMEENVLAILADDNRWAEQQNVMMSNHVVDSSVVMVTKKGTDTDEKMTVAIPNRFYIGYVMQEELEKQDVVYYDTVEECLNAVNQGSADATYVNQLVSTYFLSKMEYSNLYANSSSGHNENLAFAVNKDSDAPLLSILDKSLLCIGSDELNEIVIRNSISTQRLSLKGMMYANPGYAAGGGIALISIILFVYLQMHRAKIRKKLTEDQLQMQSETNLARTEFFMMISHEVRTPLNAVMGYLEQAINKGKRNEDNTEYLYRSLGATKQLEAIANDMLDYTKIAGNAAELKSEVFDLKEVVQNADHNMILSAAKKEIDYRFQIKNITHEFVTGDRLRLAQIIQNVISNGIKFTENGGKVEAMISEENKNEEQLEIIFTCRDTGKGMTPEYLEKICAPFEQGDKSYSRTNGGLGLGLYLTKYYVEAMSGSLQVESETGKGSCFTIRIPFRKPKSEEVLENQIDCSHVRAIICGESKEESGQLKELLERIKIKADIVADERTLCRRIRSRLGGDYEYSLCILDNLQEETAIDQIASLEAPPKIFVMTSDTEKIDELKKNEKIEHVLFKPIFQSMLFDAVMNTFGQYEEDSSSEEEFPDFTGKRAMLAEDNRVNADILERILRKAHVEVMLCENGKIAVDTFENSPEGTFDIIFMDIQMPVMDGNEATRCIRNSSLQQGKEIPIVAVSANAFQEDKDKSFASGMNEHLSKPVKIKIIYDTIRKYCCK